MKIFMLFFLILLSACASQKSKDDTSGYYSFPTGNGTTNGYVDPNGSIVDSNGSVSGFTSDPYGYAESMRNQPPPRDPNPQNK